MKKSLHSICSFLSLVTRLATPTFDHAHSPKPPPEMAIAIVLFLWLNGWSRHIWCAILLNGIWIYTCRALIPSYQKDLDVCFFATRRKVYWGLTHNLFFCWYSALISHRHRNTKHSEGWVDWHTHINTYLHHQFTLFTQQPRLLH